MENEYNSYLIIIRSAQLKYKDSFFFYSWIDICIIYKVYKTIHLSPKGFIGNKQRSKTYTKEGSYSSLPLSNTFNPSPQLPIPIYIELQVRLYCFKILKVSPPHEILFLSLKPPSQSLHMERSIIDLKQDDQKRPFI